MSQISPVASFICFPYQIRVFVSHFSRIWYRNVLPAWHMLRTDFVSCRVICMFFPEERERLRQAKLQYFGREDDSHIIYLLSKSRLGIGQEKKKNFGIVRELYKKLDTIPEISTVLKVVESSALTEIIFDFDNDSIVDLDPTKSSETKGSCYYREGRIYIGAKEQSKLLSTLSLDRT